MTFFSDLEWLNEAGLESATHTSLSNHIFTDINSFDLSDAFRSGNILGDLESVEFSPTNFHDFGDNLSFHVGSYEFDNSLNGIF